VSKTATGTLSSAKKDDENPRQKVRFKLSADCNHEHHLADSRTEVGISENLLLIMQEKWRKQQGHDVEKVSRSCTLIMN
jgi:hypothetical protein